MSKPRQWFRVENSAETPHIADIHIIDVIGSWDDDWMARNFGYDMGVTARAFIEQLAQLPESVTTIRVHINSPGGDVQGGINIANALRAQQTTKGRAVETHIEGMAASIASVIAMAGSKVVMADNALLMVHNPWGGVVGDAREMRRVADILDTMRGQIVATYQWHTAMSAEDLAAFMDAETWLNAEEALAAGFVTETVQGLQAVAAIDATAVAKLRVPERYRARVDALVKREASATPPAAAAEDVLRACREANCLEMAEGLIRDRATVEQVQARLETARVDRAAAETRAAQITALCGTAKLPALAAAYIASNMSLSGVQAQLTVVTAALDSIEIDGTLRPDAPGARAKTALAAADIYAARRNSTTKKES